MTGFVQIIEMQTSRIDDIEALLTEMRARRAEHDGPMPQRVSLTADRDRPGYYLNIIEFDSYETAMENSRRSDVGEFAGQLAKMCDGPPIFRNLDVHDSWQLSGG